MDGFHFRRITSSVVWRGDGKEIFYLDPSGEFMAAKVKENGSELAVDVASRLFQTNAEPFLHSYDVGADGQRFLVATATPRKMLSPITVVVNWMAELKSNEPP